MSLRDYATKWDVKDVSDHFIMFMDDDAASIIKSSYGISPNAPSGAPTQLSITMPSVLGSPPEAESSAKGFFDAMSIDIGQVISMLQAGATNISTNAVGLAPTNSLRPNEMINRGIQENIAKAILDWAINLLPANELRLVGIFPTVV